MPEHLSYDSQVPGHPKLVKSLRKLSQNCGEFALWLSAQCGKLTFEPRPDDVYIASYARSGTTWLQMILYQMLTDGNMDFQHITQPVPYFERALLQGRDLNKLPSPRIFKTHWRYSKLPKGPYKRIYVARNGKDVLVSCYYFFRAHSPFKGTFDEFFNKFLVGNVPPGNWFRHVAEWSAHAADPNVLFLRYEDLTNHFDLTLRRIADFLGRDISPEKFALIKERSSFQFMKQHEEKFGFLQEVLLEQGFTGDAFIRQGKTGSAKEHLSAAQDSRFDQAASGVIMPAPRETPSRTASA